MQIVPIIAFGSLPCSLSVPDMARTDNQGTCSYLAAESAACGCLEKESTLQQVEVVTG